MKLNINTPELNWPEAATIAYEYIMKDSVPQGKDNSVSVIRKLQYNIWKTKTAVNIELAK